jgi:WD40 repeat protein/serine/threonine protein kinase/tetratricopeptide (TPR) repeat protein
MTEREIFTAALAREDRAERAAFLDEACAGDVLLRQRVESLLVEHQQLGSFMDVPSQAVARTVDMPGAPLAAERAGTIIGPYKLLQKIGEGGMGVVYMAEQAVPVRRKVALKIIKPGMDTHEVIARFEAERQALALMDHPHIARVFDAGATDAGRPYFVMELVKGVPVTDYCDQNNLPVHERLELFVTVCHAVQHAHQKGIIHRDIKPSNVLVTLHDGHPIPKVIDFGVAKAIGQQLTDKTLFTQFAQMVGTPLYMSPEQAELTGLDIDTRGDIYSLGVMVYELLTGTTPFDSARMKKVALEEIRRIIREEDPPSPSTRLSSTAGETQTAVAAHRHIDPKGLSRLVRGDLDWIVMKALEKDRNRRYETANGFAADIGRYLSDEPVEACPPSAVYRFRKFARRNRGALMTLAVVVAALVLGTVVSAWQAVLATRAHGLSQERLRSETAARADAEAARKQAEKAQENEARQRDEAERDRDRALTAEESAEAARKEEAQQRSIADQKRTEADEQRAQAEQRRQEALKQERIANEQRDIAREQELLARRRFYAAQMNLANQAWEAGNPARVMDLLEGQRPRFDEEDIRTFEWYYLWQLCHSGQPLILRGHQRWVNSLAFAPDAKTLASCGTDGTVRLWDVASGRSVTIFRGNADVPTVAFSPDGKTLAWVSHDRMVRICDVATRQIRATLQGHTNLVWSLAFSPDGTMLATGSQDKTVRLWDLADGMAVATLQGHDWPILSVAWSPDGKTVVSASTWAIGAKVWDVASRKERFMLQGGSPVAFLPDGRLACLGHGYEVSVWDVVTGKKQADLRGTGSNLSVAIPPDGKSVGFGAFDRNVTLWDITTGQTRAHHARLVPIHSVAFSPDGKFVASGGDDGVIELRDMVGVGAPAELQPGGIVSSNVTFSPDGTTVVTGSARGMKRWETTTGNELVSAQSNMQGDGRIALSPDGNIVASASGDAIRLWDLKTDQEISVLRGHTGQICGLAFAPDGKSLASCGAPANDGTAKLWDLGTGSARVTIKGISSIADVAFSPDGMTLATGGQEMTLQLWDAKTGRPKAALQQDMMGHHVWVFSLAFSPDGKTLAAGGSYGSLNLWDVSLGQVRAVLKGHTQRIDALAFSPNGLTLASGSADGSVKLWDVSNGQERLTLKGHGGSVNSAAFAADGLTLATGSADGTVRLWRATTDDEAVARKAERDSDDPGSALAKIKDGNRLRSDARPREAEQAYGQAVSRLEKLIAAFPKDAAYRDDLARCCDEWSTSMRNGGRFREAEPVRRRATALWENLSAEFPDDQNYRRNFGGSLWRLGGLLAGVGQPLEAEKVYRRSLEVFQKLATDFPQVSYYQQDVAYTYWALLGRTLAAAPGRATDAEQAYRQGMAAHEKLVAEFPNHPGVRSRLAANYTDLIKLLRTSGQPQEAMKVCQRAVDFIEAYRHALEADKKLVAASNSLNDRWLFGGNHESLGQLLREAGRFDEAEQAFRQAIEIWMKLVAEFNVEDHRWHLGRAYEELGHALKARRRFEEAIEAYRQALIVWKKLVADFNDPDRRTHLSWTQGWLIEVLLAQARQMDIATEIPETDRKAKAQEYRTQAKELLRDGIERGLQTPLSINNTAWHLATDPNADLRDPGSAAELAELAVELAPDNATFANTLGVAHYRTGNWHEAIKALEKSEQLAPDKYLGFNGFFIAVAHWQLGNKSQAREWFDRSVEWVDKRGPSLIPAHQEELRRFRAEAEELMGVEGK